MQWMLALLLVFVVHPWNKHGYCFALLSIFKTTWKYEVAKLTSLFFIYNRKHFGLCIALDFSLNWKKVNRTRIFSRFMILFFFDLSCGLNHFHRRYSILSLIYFGLVIFFFSLWLNKVLKKSRNSRISDSSFQNVEWFHE